MPDPIRAVAYYRFSDPKQDASIAQQSQWAEAAAPRHGVEIVRAFQDEGIPGDEILSRGGLQALLAFCEQRRQAGGPVRAVVCWDADRLSRADSFRTAGVICRLLDAGVTRMLTNEGWTDWEDDTDRLVYGVRQEAGKAAYARSVSGSVARARLQRALRGEWTGGPAPFGYVRGPDAHLALGERAHWETVQLLAREYLARDVGACRLAAEFNAAGRPFPTQRGRTQWTDDLVYQLLTDPQYTGDLYYNRNPVSKYHKTTGDGRVQRSRPRRNKAGTPLAVRNAPEDVIVCEKAHPVIIDRETFAAVQRKLASRRVGGGKRGGPGRGDYPFSGLLECGDCGACLYGVTQVQIHKGKRYTWRKYSCSRYMESGGRECHINAVCEAALLEKVALVLEQRYSDPACLEGLRARLLARRRARGRASDGAVQALRRRRADLAGKIARGQENLALAKTEKDFAHVSAILARWEVEAAEVGREVEEAERLAAAQEHEAAAVEAALQRLQEAGGKIRAAAAAGRRDVLRGLVARVELHFTHRPWHSGKVRSELAGGTIYLRDDLGSSDIPGGASPTPDDLRPDFVLEMPA